jgi:preprotein translocase SecE subunit
MALIQYIKETRTELNHVNWPTRRQTIAFTVVVILVSLGASFFLGFFDFLLKLGVDTFIFKQ